MVYALGGVLVFELFREAQEAVVTLARGNGRRAAIMRPSSVREPCSLALGVALLSLHAGEAFLCPTAVLGSSRGSIAGVTHRQQPQQQQRQQQQRLAGTRWVVAAACWLFQPLCISSYVTHIQHLKALCRCRGYAGLCGSVSYECAAAVRLIALSMLCTMLQFLLMWSRGV